MLAAFKKNGFAYHSLSLVAFIIMMSLILFRLFGRLYPALSSQMPSYHFVRRQGVLYSGHLGSGMWVVTGWIGYGNSRSQQSPESPLVILVSQRRALISIVAGLSLKIVDWCGLGAGSEEPLVLVFSRGNHWTKSQRFNACNWHS